MEREKKIIEIVEHPGYMETMDDVFDIEAGDYSFVVKNQSNKDSGFVVLREGESPAVVKIKKNETGVIDVKLRNGNYCYFCPLIPTPTYSIKVK